MTWEMLKANPQFDKLLAERGLFRKDFVILGDAKPGSSTEPVHRTFVFDSQTIWLIRDALAEAVKTAKTKASARRLFELSEHVFLRSVTQQDTTEATPLGFDFKTKKALPPV
jgi:hypothetical protein